ncbi:MAG: hypothetical protein AMXMBFR33_10180 [Candidatus Xenobia bacterium]
MTEETSKHRQGFFFIISALQPLAEQAMGAPLGDEEDLALSPGEELAGAGVGLPDSPEHPPARSPATAAAISLWKSRRFMVSPPFS